VIDESADHFRSFASNLENAISKYEVDEDVPLLERQRRQIRCLIGLETKFRKALIAHRWGPGVYEKFVRFICEKNILDARPYFRERQVTFTEYISTVLKKRRARGLYRFRFNYMFVLFVLRCCRWSPGSQIVAIAKEIAAIRQELAEMNMPLAISRARRFWSSTPKSHLSYMDLVQIHCAGLLAAVDKFVPRSTRGMTKTQVLEEYRKFRAVAIGRMAGDVIERYSETLVHFYPVDKRKIYRANKRLRQFQDQVDHVILSELVNAEVENPAHRTNPSEIADLLAAASVVSLTENVGPESRPEKSIDAIIDRHSAQNDQSEEKLQNADAMVSMQESIEGLGPVEKKILKMKGVNS